MEMKLIRLIVVFDGGERNIIPASVCSHYTIEGQVLSYLEEDFSGISRYDYDAYRDGAPIRGIEQLGPDIEVLEIKTRMQMPAEEGK